MSERLSRRRVKLYALNHERQWDDRGTGHVTSTYLEHLKGMSLLVRAESDGETLLESKIQTDTAYQKQQGTLIVWSEAENFDLALSFQEKAGCDEIWEKICQVQGKDPSVDYTQEVVDESEEERYEEGNDSGLYVELPNCEISKLEQINEVIVNSLHNVNRQDKIATCIENEAYIKKLLELFKTCEDLCNTESLHVLYEIFKNLFMLNKNSLLEVLCSEDNIFDVVGVLEYDPSSATQKKHREFLKNTCKFNQVVPFPNIELINKIHQTYRVQYIQDVALPNQAVFEENMPSTLSSFIFFNKVEIVTALQEDESFLQKVFHLLKSDTVDVDKRRDLILFLKEFCTFSQTLQPPSRDNFYKTLSRHGVLDALEISMSVDDPVVKAASTDVLGFFVELSPSMVREHMLQQLEQHKDDEEHFLLNIMLEQMVMDLDPEMGGAVQIMGILRILLDPENMLTSSNKAERTDFLAFFYKHCMHYLIAPVMANTVNDVVCREDFQTAQLISLILELVAFFVEHHNYHIKNYVIHRDLLRRILVLTRSRHTFLVLGAIRILRKIVGLKDEFYNRHIISGNYFAPIIETYVRNNGRYNLLDSAILEIFEFIKSEDIRSLILYCMEKFSDVFSGIDYVQTFVTLKARYNTYMDKIRDREKSTAAVQSLGMVRATNTPTNTARFRRDNRDLEVEEELWFNSDECEEEFQSPLKQELLKGSSAELDDAGCLDDDDDDGSLFGVQHQHSRLSSSLLHSSADKLTKDCVSLMSNSPPPSHLQQPHAPSLVPSAGSSPTIAAGISLVDYDENSDEEEEEDLEMETTCSVSGSKNISSQANAKGAGNAIRRASANLLNEITDDRTCDGQDMKTVCDSSFSASEQLCSPSVGLTTSPGAEDEDEDEKQELEVQKTSDACLKNGHSMLSGDAVAVAAKKNYEVVSEDCPQNGAEDESRRSTEAEKAGEVNSSLLSPKQSFMTSAETKTSHAVQLVEDVSPVKDKDKKRNRSDGEDTEDCVTEDDVPDAASNVVTEANHQILENKECVQSVVPVTAKCSLADLEQPRELKVGADGLVDGEAERKRPRLEVTE